MKPRTVLCVFYGALALVALVATWSQNLAYFAGGGAAAGGAFLADLRVNPASRSISVDIALLFLAAAVFMVLEARRLGIRFVWAYIVGGMLIAISVTFPLFLVARERKLAESDSRHLSWSNGIPLALFAAIIAAVGFYVIAPAA